MIENNPKEPVKLIVTRSVKSKATEEGKLQNFNPGDPVTMQAKYAHELVSIRKAVVVGSAAHEAWIEKQKSAAARKKADPKASKLEAKFAATAEELGEAKAKIAELEEQLAEATKPKK